MVEQATEQATNGGGKRDSVRPSRSLPLGAPTVADVTPPFQSAHVRMCLDIYGRLSWKENRRGGWSSSFAPSSSRWTTRSPTPISYRPGASPGVASTTCGRSWARSTGSRRPCLFAARASGDLSGRENLAAARPGGGGDEFGHVRRRRRARAAEPADNPLLSGEGYRLSHRAATESCTASSASSNRLARPNLS